MESGFTECESCIAFFGNDRACNTDYRLLLPLHGPSYAFYR